MMDTLNKDGMLVEVFAAYGRAMLDAHGLELRLATLLSVRVILAGGTENEQNKAIARIEQQPLGGLIQDFIASYEPSDEIVEELDNMRYFRNELTHRVSRMILLSAIKEKWEIPLIKKLDEISTIFRETSCRLEPFMAEYRHKVGVRDETMHELACRLYPGTIESV